MTDIKTPTLMTIRQFIDKHPAFTLGGMRNYIFFEELNGLKASGAIKRMGRKILIDTEPFFNWVNSCPQTKWGKDAENPNPTIR